MQHPQFSDFRAGKKTAQGAMEQLLSRARSVISNVILVTHSGRKMQDLEEIALRGPPLTIDDLVSLCAVPAYSYSCYSIRRVAGVRRCYGQPAWHNQRQRVSCKYFISIVFVELNVGLSSRMS